MKKKIKLLRWYSIRRQSTLMISNFTFHSSAEKANNLNFHKFDEVL